MKQAKSRQEIMSSLPPVPTDDRMSEISAALLFVGTISVSLLVKGLIPLLFDRDGYYTLYTTIIPDGIITTLIGGLVLDNFYDAIMTLLNISNVLPKNFKLPPKDKLPLGVGQGNLTKQVVAGLSRLLTVDTGA